MSRQLSNKLIKKKLPMSLKKVIELISKPERKLEDLKKAAWYLNREIIKLENI